MIFGELVCDTVLDTRVAADGAVFATPVEVFCPVYDHIHERLDNHGYHIISRVKIKASIDGGDDRDLW